MPGMRRRVSFETVVVPLESLLTPSLATLAQETPLSVNRLTITGSDGFGLVICPVGWESVLAIDLNETIADFRLQMSLLLLLRRHHLPWALQKLHLHQRARVVIFH